MADLFHLTSAGAFSLILVASYFMSFSPHQRTLRSWVETFSCPSIRKFWAKNLPERLIDFGRKQLGKCLKGRNNEIQGVVPKRYTPLSSPCEQKALGGDNNKKIVVKKENKHNENKFQFITRQCVMMLRVARLPESPIKSIFTVLHCPRCCGDKHFHLDAIKANVKQLRPS